MRLEKISGLVSIGPILNKIQLFKNLKINKRCMGRAANSMLCSIRNSQAIVLFRDSSASSDTGLI